MPGLRSTGYVHRVGSEQFEERVVGVPPFGDRKEALFEIGDT